MTGFATALRIVLGVLAACFVLWVVATARANARMEKELEVLESVYRQVVSNTQRLTKAAGAKDARERVVYKRFIEYRERASEAVDVECDPRALDEQYVEQLRLAAAAAVRLPDGTTRVAGPDGDLGTVTVHAR
jgi:hypothetical protein